MTIRFEVAASGTIMQLRAILSPWLIVPILQAGLASAEPSIQIPQVPNGADASVPIYLGPYGKRHAFPDIRDWSSLRIRLERTACLGTCPVYSVEIDGDGVVTYDGLKCVAAKGPRVGRITREQVRAIFAAFKQADFFSLRYAYNENTMDAPGTEMTLAYDAWRMSVRDAVDTEGLPPDAAKLPDTIDRAADTAAWIGKPVAGC